jgi:CheY-like chemotaxis protein
MRQINPIVRAVLASGYSLEGEAQKLLEAGMAGFLAKPFRLAELQSAVLAALDPTVCSRPRA